MSICIECAVEHHDFREVTNVPACSGTWTEAGFREAWIDGRKYKLRNVSAYHVSCNDCHRLGVILFMPAKD